MYRDFGTPFFAGGFISECISDCASLTCPRPHACIASDRMRFDPVKNPGLEILKGIVVAGAACLSVDGVAKCFPSLPAGPLVEMSKDVRAI